MIDLLTLDDEQQLVINPQLLTVECFSKVWKRDHGESIKGKRVKYRATKELALVYFMEYWNSPYASYMEEVERLHQIKKAIGLDEDWKQDDKIKECRLWYSEHQLSTSPTIAALEAARVGLNEVKEFLNGGTVLKMVNMAGNPIYKPKDLIAAIEDLPKAQKAIVDLEEQIRREINISSTIRGGGEKGMYE